MSPFLCKLAATPESDLIEKALMADLAEDRLDNDPKVGLDPVLARSKKVAANQLEPSVDCEPQVLLGNIFKNKGTDQLV